MAEGLTTADGEVLDVDRAEAEFAAAMAAPPVDRPGLAAPERRPPEPPADPETAPHGWMWDRGEWRPKKAPGRPRAASEDKPRVASGPAPKVDKPKGSSKLDEAKSPTDFRKTVRETAEAAWFVLASTPVPEQVFGFKTGNLRTKLRVQAALVEANVDGLANGLNLVAQHNRFVAAGLSRLASGEGGLWVLPAVMMLAPFVAGTGQLWAGQLADAATLEDLAGQQEQKAAAYLEQMAAAATAEA